MPLIYKALGDFEQAKEYLQRALQIELDKLGKEHVNIATSYLKLSSIHIASNDYEQATEYQQRALEIELEKLGSEHVNVATSYHNFASIYHALGDLEQAKEFQQWAAMLLEKLLWMRRGMIWNIISIEGGVIHQDKNPRLIASQPLRSA